MMAVAYIKFMILHWYEETYYMGKFDGPELMCEVIVENKFSFWEKVAQGENKQSFENGCGERFSKWSAVELMYEMFLSRRDWFHLGKSEKYKLLRNSVPWLGMPPTRTPRGAHCPLPPWRRPRNLESRLLPFALEWRTMCGPTHKMHVVPR